MSSIPHLRQQLHDLGIPYYVEGRRVIVDPVTMDGFRVLLVDDDQEPEVHFDSWKQLCKTPDEAHELFLLGLSNRARLRVACSEGTPVCWALQTQENGLWRAGAIIGKVAEHTDMTVYLQNDHVRKVSPPPPQWDTMDTAQLMVQRVV